MEPTPIRRVSSGGLAFVPPEGTDEESPRRRLFASAAKEIKSASMTSSHHQNNPLQQHLASSAVASTPPALASLLTPLAGGSPQALCCAGVSPRALFGGGRSVNAEAKSMSSKCELLPPFSSPKSTPAVVQLDDDDDNAAAGDTRRNKMGGLVAATHAVSFFSFFLVCESISSTCSACEQGERDRASGSAREKRERRGKRPTLFCPRRAFFPRRGRKSVPCALHPGEGRRPREMPVFFTRTRSLSPTFLAPPLGPSLSRIPCLDCVWLVRETSSR